MTKDNGSTQRSGGRAFRLHKADHDPRAAALAALSQVLFNHVDSQAALDEVLRSPSMVPTDKRLCTELVYGVLRRYITLEGFAGEFLRRPDKLPAEMLLTVLVAVYEMACLRIPHHASVGWAVEHVRNRFGQGLSKVANGALRTMQRSLRNFENPHHIASVASSEEERLSRLFGVPVWIVSLWLQSYGPEATHILLAAARDAAPVGIRLNRARSSWERFKKELVQLYNQDVVRTVSGAATPPGLVAVPVEAQAHASVGADSEPSLSESASQPESPQAELFLAGQAGLAFPGTPPWQLRTLLEEGKASRQSAASYDVLEAFTPGSWQLPIWDCCAGRGGKTLALLEQGIPVELASDQSEQRLSALPREYARLGLTVPARPEVLPLSVQEAALRLTGQEPSRRFGTIVIDAPCSGLGTLSRRPEIRFRRTPESLDALATLQRQILALTWEHLSPGGSLIYLTCTLNPAENQGQIADFLAVRQEAEFIKEFQTDFSSPLREFFYGAQIRKPQE